MYNDDVLCCVMRCSVIASHPDCCWFVPDHTRSECRDRDLIFTNILVCIIFLNWPGFFEIEYSTVVLSFQSKYFIFSFDRMFSDNEKTSLKWSILLSYVWVWVGDKNFLVTHPIPQYHIFPTKYWMKYDFKYKLQFAS